MPSQRPLPVWFLDALTFYRRCWPGLRIILESGDGDRAVLPVPSDPDLQAAPVPADAPTPESPTFLSPDGRSLRWFGKPYAFTEMQAPAVLLLFAAWGQGLDGVADAELLTAAGSDSARLADLFSSCEAWGKIIGPASRRGMHRLKPPA